jgi:FixJ family two-component response regulator
MQASVPHLKFMAKWWADAEARMPYRVPTALVLSEAERGELEGWARRRKTAQALALRARIVLRAAAGLSNTAIAAELGVAKHTVGKWRERFARLRADGRECQEFRVGAAMIR